MLDFDPAEVIAAVKADPSFSEIGRFVTVTVVLKDEDRAFTLELDDGTLKRFERGAAAKADYSIFGPTASWGQLFSTHPKQGFTDTLLRTGGSQWNIDGDYEKAIAPTYHAVQAFIDILRRVKLKAPLDATIPEVERDFDAAVGRYMYVRIHGVQYRIYFEESGEGDIPLLLQHTAGADGRQWRHILEDPDYRKQFRIIAYDLPFHGKSVPPTSVRWWESRYVLRREWLIDAVVAISRKLKLDRPVYMGCSVGGMLAPDLAYYRPDEFRAVIALNGSLKLEAGNAIPGYERTFSSPHIGPQWKAAMMRSNTAPTSPDAYRRETSWIYSQGAPPVLEGDVFYHTKDHDLTCEQAQAIDTSKIDVYLLTGEYDMLAGPRGTPRLAEAVKDCYFEISPGLGHFGPAENPGGFKKVLMPVLENIAAGKRARDLRR